MKELKCRDAGFDCDAVVRADSEAEVMEQVAEHARTAHGVEVEGETAEKVRSLIHEA